MDFVKILVYLLVLFALFAEGEAKDCAFQLRAEIKRREEPIFDRDNFEEKCKGHPPDYGRPVAKCNGYFLNPKCVCSYYMYEYDIEDVCKKSAPDTNGSLLHRTVEFCKNYSYSGNGPCQNNGTLIGDNKTLAEEAKCSCETNYKGEFCDIYTGKIKCQVTNSKMNSSLPKCEQSEIGSRYCVLTLNNVNFLCDSQDHVPDDMEECSSIPLEDLHPKNLEQYKSIGNIVFLNFMTFAVCIMLTLCPFVK